MSGSTDSERQSDRIEVYLKALLLLKLRPLIDEKKQGSIEGLLFRAGFTNREIVEMTGTAQSTVSTRLKSEGLVG